jgi:hypothetical protein
MWYYEQVACFLRAVPLLKPFKGPKLDALVALLRTAAYDDGQFIIKQGERGDALYFLRSGGCRAIINGKPSHGRVCHYVPISTERAQSYIRSWVLLSTLR